MVEVNGASTSVKSTLVWFSPFKKKKPPVKVFSCSCLGFLLIFEGLYIVSPDGMSSEAALDLN